MIFADMANVGMFKRVNKTARNAPVIVVVSDIETLGNRDHNWGRMVGVVRHTLGVRATLLFSSQRAAERLLALTNPCWSLPIGCSWFTEDESKALLPYTPLKVKIWR